MKGEGPSLPPPLQATRLTFWESLIKGGGKWMWDYVSDRSSELHWLKTALEQGTDVLTMDGSYSWSRGPNVSGAGWIIACHKCRKMLSGSFYEVSSNASPYQGELLGLIALHTLILQVCQYYQLTSVKGKIICNSKSALKESSKKRRWIRPVKFMFSTVSGWTVPDRISWFWRGQRGDCPVALRINRNIAVHLCMATPKDFASAPTIRSTSK